VRDLLVGPTNGLLRVLASRVGLLHKSLQSVAALLDEPLQENPQLQARALAEAERSIRMVALPLIEEGVQRLRVEG
jgi:hypothetical protein